MQERRADHHCGSVHTDGRLERQEQPVDPYLTGVADDRLQASFRKIFANRTEPARDGRIGPLSVSGDDACLRRLAHSAEPPAD